MLTTWVKKQEDKGRGIHERENRYVKNTGLRIPTELLHSQSKKRKKNNIIVLDNYKEETEQLIERNLAGDTQ